MIDEHVRVHPQRYALTNELHARPFAPMTAPGRVVCLAFKTTGDVDKRDLEAERQHLIALLDRHGGAHPAPGANHHFADFDRVRLKWERHTEMVTYTLYESGAADGLFTMALARQFPAGWLADAPGELIAASEVELLSADRVEDVSTMIEGRLGTQFAGESLAVARVLDGEAVALGDFRIHEGGAVRFAVVIHGEMGPQRTGRIVQRMLEIENYRALAMLSLPVARDTAETLNRIERALNDLIQGVARGDAAPPEKEILGALTTLSAEIEALAASTAFRFAAGQAYEAIVNQRIEMLREGRLDGRQLFREFMLRRFDPAMRTCQSVIRRLHSLALRASRIADLLRTRVDVALEAQNQQLLKSMDRRAAMQLRLQETVEGLSVVAISYYAVSLAALVLAPVAERAGMDKTAVTALIALPVIGIVWWFVRRIRKRIDARNPD